MVPSVLKTKQPNNQTKNPLGSLQTINQWRFQIFSERIRCFQNERVFHFPFSPTPGRGCWTCTPLTLALKKSVLARTVDSRQKPSADGRDCGERAQTPSAGISGEQSWQGGGLGHRCREAQGRGWGARGGPFPPSWKSAFMPVYWKGGHGCLNPLIDLQFKDTSWLKVGRRACCFLHHGADPRPLALLRHLGYRTRATWSGIRDTK